MKSTGALQASSVFFLFIFSYLIARLYESINNMMLSTMVEH